MFKSDIRDLAIRQSIAAGVAAIESVVARKFVVKVPPDRAFEIIFEMGHPVAGFDQRRTLAGSCIGDLHAVLALAEADFLFVRGGRRLDRLRGRRGDRIRESLDIPRRNSEHADGARNILYGLLAE